MNLRLIVVHHFQNLFKVMIFLFSLGILEESHAYSDEEYYDQDYNYSGYSELKFKKEGLADEESRNNV